MATRSALKQLTRMSIIESALDSFSEEVGFTSLSLRDVAKAAGIAPTSFYRHFKDLEELGLVLVDEAGLTLRQLMREAREHSHDRDQVLHETIDTFMRYIHQNPNLFRFLSRIWLGGSAKFRQAMGKEIDHAIRELAEELVTVGSVRYRPLKEPEVVAEAIVSMVFSIGVRSLDRPEEERGKIAEKIIKQVRMIYIGAEVLSTNESAKPTHPKLDLSNS